MNPEICTQKYRNILPIVFRLAIITAAAYASAKAEDLEYSNQTLSSSSKDGAVVGSGMTSESTLELLNYNSITFSGNQALNTYSSAHTTKDGDIAAGAALYAPEISIQGTSGAILFNDNIISAKTSYETRPSVKGGAIKGNSINIDQNTGTSIIFDGNIALDSIYDPTTATSVPNSTFSYGGAIYGINAISLANNGQAAITFSNNVAGKGGALAAGYQGSITLADNGELTFTGNKASYGGAIYTGASTYLNNKDTVGYGTLDISRNAGVSFVGNSATNNGGAIYNQTQGTVNISNNTGDVSFQNNTAALYGGAIRGQSYSTISLNENTGTVSLSANSITRSEVVQIYGGAISSDANSTININGNGAVSINSNSLSTNSSTYGGAIAAYNSTVNICKNTGAVDISGNTITSVKTSSWGSITAEGAAIYAKVLNLQNNSSTVTITNNVASVSGTGSAMGGAFLVQDSLNITGNADVIFRNNLQKDDTQTILRSVYVNSKSATGALNLAAAQGSNITFYDSIYAAPSSNSYSLTTDFNKAYIDKNGQSAKANGSIIFNGKFAEADLLAHKATATIEEITASMTSHISGSVNLHAGTLSIQERAIFQSDGLVVKNGATLDLQNGTISQTGASLNTEGGSTLQFYGANTLSADTIQLADSTTINLIISEANAVTESTTASALMSIACSSLNYNAGVVNVQGLDKLAEGQYLIADFSNATNLPIEGEWATNAISLTGLGSGDFFSWNDTGTHLYLNHVLIPEPTTASLSLLALVTLVIRRRRD